MKQPYRFTELWGVWIPNGGPDSQGSWMQHVDGPNNGPLAFETEADAKTHAASEAPDDFPGIFAERMV